MKLIINCNRTLLEQKKDVTVLRQLETIKKIYSDVLYVGHGWNDGYVDLQQAINKYNPDVIFYAADFYYNDAHLPIKTNCIKIACMQDYWDDVETRLQILHSQNINKVVTKNALGLNLYIEKINNFNFIVNPSGYDDNIFKNSSIEKEYDILISGALCKHRYPNRVRLASIANKLSNSVNVYKRDHPGYFYNTEDIKNEQLNYCLDMNKSKIAIASTALDGLNLHMQKIWEISATSALCLTDLNKYEPDYKLLNQHVYEIDMNKSDEHIQDELVYILKNYETIKSNIIQYNKIVESYANLNNRALHLLNSIKSLANI